MTYEYVKKQRTVTQKGIAFAIPFTIAYLKKQPISEPLTTSL